MFSDDGLVHSLLRMHFPLTEKTTKLTNERTNKRKQRLRELPGERRREGAAARRWEVEADTWMVRFFFVSSYRPTVWVAGWVGLCHGRTGRGCHNPPNLSNNHFAHKNPTPTHQLLGLRREDLDYPSQGPFRDAPVVLRPGHLKDITPEELEAFGLVEKSALKVRGCLWVVWCWWFCCVWGGGVAWCVFVEGYDHPHTHPTPRPRLFSTVNEPGDGGVPEPPEGVPPPRAPRDVAGAAQGTGPLAAPRRGGRPGASSVVSVGSFGLSTFDDAGVRACA